MQFKKGSGWMACFDAEHDRYTAEYGGCMDYHLYEISKEIFDCLDERMTESDACFIIRGGRHLYMSVSDRCGPPYTVVLDDDYRTLCPWANAAGGEHVWPDALTDAAAELFAAEDKSREQRRKKRAQNSPQ